MERKIETCHLDFITAGHSYFTLRNESNGCRVTYRVIDAATALKKKDMTSRQLLFVSYLNGPENTKNYAS